MALRAAVLRVRVQVTGLSRRNEIEHKAMRHLVLLAVVH